MQEPKSPISRVISVPLVCTLGTVKCKLQPWNGQSQKSEHRSQNALKKLNSPRRNASHFFGVGFILRQSAVSLPCPQKDSLKPREHRSERAGLTPSLGEEVEIKRTNTRQQALDMTCVVYFFVVADFFCLVLRNS